MPHASNAARSRALRRFRALALLGLCSFCALGVDAAAAGGRGGGGGGGARGGAGGGRPAGGGTHSTSGRSRSGADRAAAPQSLGDSNPFRGHGLAGMPDAGAGVDGAPGRFSGVESRGRAGAREDGAAGLSSERGAFSRRGAAAGSAPETAGGSADRPFSRAGAEGAAGAKERAAAAAGAVENAAAVHHDVALDADVDAALEVSGTGEALEAAAAAYPFHVPAYAAWYGYAPALASVYFPPSTASVTIVEADGSTSSTSTLGASSSAAAAPALAPAAVPAAVDQAMSSLERMPEASGCMQAGAMAFADRRYLDAAEQFRRAIPLDLDNALPRFSFAHALFALGDYASACYSLRRGFDLMPDWVSSGNDFRALYGELADFDDQRAALAAHCTVNPADGDARVVRGYVDFFSGDLAGAEAAFRAHRAADPADPISEHFLAEIARARKSAR